MLVIILQISIGGRTLEDYLMSFIQTSDSLAPVRDIAYSSVRRMNPNVQIKEPETRMPASVPPSSPPSPPSPSSSSRQSSSMEFKKDLIGGLLKTFLSQYKGMMKNALKSTDIVEGHHLNLQKELDNIADVTTEQSPPSAPAKQTPQKENK